MEVATRTPTIAEFRSELSLHRIKRRYVRSNYSVAPERTVHAWPYSTLRTSFRHGLPEWRAAADPTIRLVIGLSRPTKKTIIRLPFDNARRVHRGSFQRKQFRGFSLFNPPVLIVRHDKLNLWCHRNTSICFWGDDGFVFFQDSPSLACERVTQHCYQANMGK